MNEQNNVQTVQQLYACFGRGDIPTLLSLLAKDIDWQFYGPAEIPFAGHYRSHKDLGERFFKTIGATVDVLQFEPREFIAGGDQIVVLGFERVRAKATGRTWETHWAHVWTLCDGKIVKLREFYDTAAMAEAFRGA